VQSTAALVLAAKCVLDFPLFLFANVGDDSEHPATLAYVRTVAAPYAAAHKIALVELQRARRDGTTETLRSRLGKRQRGLTIPVRLPSGAPARRHCTHDFKVEVIGRELRRRGASTATVATVGLGISVDEAHRARSGAGRPYEQRTYPLLDLGLTRQDCLNLVADAGLPTPPKSACYFCPFSSPQRWRELRRDHPDLWTDAVALEEELSERGLGRVRMTDIDLPLPFAIDGGGDQLSLDACESGFCFT
jgi:hypothetical protein